MLFCLFFRSDFAPQRLLVDPRAAFIFYTESTTSAIYRLKTDGSEHRMFLAPTHAPFALANDYDNGWLFFSTRDANNNNNNNNGEVWRVNVNNADSATLITNQPSQPTALAYLSTGVKLKLFLTS